MHLSKADNQRPGRPCRRKITRAVDFLCETWSLALNDIDAGVVSLMASPVCWQVAGLMSLPKGFNWSVQGPGSQLGPGPCHVQR